MRASLSGFLLTKVSINCENVCNLNMNTRKLTLRTVIQEARISPILVGKYIVVRQADRQTDMQKCRKADS